MIIKKIIIKNLGNVKSFEYDFSKGLNIVNNVMTNEISFALRFVSNNKTLSRLPHAGVSADTEISAEVIIDSKKYYVKSEIREKKQKAKEKICFP